MVSQALFSILRLYGGSTGIHLKWDEFVGWAKRSVPIKFAHKWDEFVGWAKRSVAHQICPYKVKAYRWARAIALCPSYLKLLLGLTLTRQTGSSGYHSGSIVKIP
jgi:hypothetical protein